MPRRPNRAEQAALGLLEERWDGELPIAVERIAKDQGVKLRYEDFDGDLSGALYRADGTIVIGVNGAHSETRQRFTIAHELAHLQLHSDALFIDGFLARDAESSLAINSDEIEANAFAAELLMPRHIVLREIRNYMASSGKWTIQRLISRLATQFNVSEQAMQIRFANLGIATSF